MYLNISYDTDFIELMLFLKAKYGQKMFDLDGIGVQLDINNFSKDFFNNKTTTADISIDSNSNISTKDMIVYNTELPKSYFRLNAYYLIWKKLKQLYSRVEANKIIEMQLSGDIYINDFHGINMAYSYHPHTTIIIKINNEIKNITMESLFSELSFFIENNENCDFINTSKLNIDILDNGEWVKLNRILRHISHTDLLRIETKRGAVSVITEDHPVILKDGSEKLAINICEADELLSNSRYALQGTKKVNNNIAYIIGAMIGDGYVSNGKCVLVQNDIVNTHFYKLIKDNYTHVNVEKINRLNFGTIDTAKEYSKLIGLMALNKHLPYDFLEWDYESRLSLMSGLIDTDGTINKRNGVVDVRLISFAAIQQIAELASSLGFNRIRTSIVNKQKESHKSYKNNYKLYRVSFRVNNKDIIKKSIKIKNNIDIAFKIAGVDGRWESDFINKIDKIEWEGNFVYDVTTETGTFYNNGLTVHNCYNYSTYDIALNGLSMVNKIYSIKPKYLYSFKSQLEQFVVIASNSTLGAVGLADLFIVMGHYVDNILDTLSDAGFNFKATEDCWKYIKENIVSFIYTINQPSRANQSPFTNVSIFDDIFLNKLVPEYIFENGKSPKISTIKKIQEIFMDTMNEELRRTPVTFPITTACFAIDENNNIIDKDFLNLISEKNIEFGFINLYCGKTSTLSSCCRLRSETDNEYFNSFGSGSTQIGSLGVVTINLPRLAYKYNDKEIFIEELISVVDVVGKINNAKRHIIKKKIDGKSQPLYNLGFMDINRQYSTCGLNGINEALQLLGFDILTNSGIDFAISMFDVINKTNERLQKQYKAPHNCEQTPSENSSIKLAKKDELLDYNTGFVFYSNQFIPLITKADMLDRIEIQGKFDKHFSGGSICHINVEDRIGNFNDMALLIETCAKMGVIYFAINYNLQKCKNNHMTVGKTSTCSICTEPIEASFTRVVGFLTAVKNWNEVRRTYDYPNRQFYGSIK